jgi:hypothetical protein
VPTLEYEPLRYTLWVLSVMKDFNKRIEFELPEYISSFFINIEWSTRSKALDRSKKTVPER